MRILARPTGVLSGRFRRRLRRFQRRQFLEPLLVPAARESRIQPDIDDRNGLFFGKNARAHGQHIEVIVLARHPRLVFAADVGGAEPGVLLAAIAMPMPLPQTRMPRCATPEATRQATACAKSG